MVFFCASTVVSRVHNQTKISPIYIREYASLTFDILYHDFFGQESLPNVNYLQRRPEVRST